MVQQPGRLQIFLALVFLCILFFSVGAPLFSNGKADAPPGAQAASSSSPSVPDYSYGMEDTPIAAEPLPMEGLHETSRAEQVMKALAAAYPDRISPAEYRDGDWSVSIRGIRYFYAEGRLLPEELRDRAAEFDPQPFYNYPAELPPWKDPSPEEGERFRRSAQRRSENPPKRSQHFYDALWRAGTHAESYERVKTIRFMGRSALVHYSIMEELALVEERIKEAAKTDRDTQRWIDSIDTLTGWNWRSIADTQSRSFHAYGAALDILPANLRGLQTYWLWTSEYNPEWWAVPYSRRYHPPEAVIKAFEAYGFIWGGKWLFFDTMHFEYRPELFILSGIELSKEN